MSPLAEHRQEEKPQKKETTLLFHFENTMETNSTSDDDVDQHSTSIHVEPFHRLNRVDGTFSFQEQILSMEQIVSTNGIDGQMIDRSTNSTGGIWKEILHQGIGQNPSIGASWSGKVNEKSSFTFRFVCF